MPSYSYPAPPPGIPPTPLAEIDAIVDRVASAKRRWIQTTPAERVRLLEQLLLDTHAQAAAVVDKAMAAKGLAPSHPSWQEDWLVFAWVTLDNITRLIASYRHLRDTGELPIPRPIRMRPTGQIAVETFPDRLSDRLLFMGFRGQVVMQPGVTAETLQQTMGVHVKSPAPDGKLCFILGAGNVASIPFMDSLYKLFVENEVAIIKMNPVNDYVGPHLRLAFRALVDAGFFDVVYGDAEQGAHLCNHAAVDSIHITGSDATHDRIVWGPRDGQAGRKASGEPVNNRPITSELGNVTPIVVVPGAWSESDLRAQAVNIASMVTNNASFNCIAGKLLVTAAGWPLRERLLDHVREVLAGVPTRKAYYPGAHDRWREYLAAHPDAETIGEAGAGVVPWTLIPGLDPARSDDICFTTEPFCAMLSEVPLAADNPVDFLSAAVDFCNDVVWGTLSTGILVHPSTRKDPAVEGALQDAIDNTRYGGIAINHWAGIPYAFSTLPWGAHPGHTLDDIGSGIGVVHNALMFDRPQKSILEGPFRVFPKPAWFVSHRRSGQVGRTLCDFQVDPGLARFVSVLWNALRG